jgi:hypothetical protein
VAMGLSRFIPTCCSSYRVAFLAREHVPHLVRLSDAYGGCELAQQVYACTEGRVHAMRSTDPPNVREAKKALLAACRVSARPAGGAAVDTAAADDAG